MSLPRIVVTFVYPPIPIREFDYQAHYAGEEDEQMDVGHGRTAADAVVDLIENYPRGVFCAQVRRCDECVHFRTMFWREHDGSENSAGYCDLRGHGTEAESRCYDHEFVGERHQVTTLPEPLPWREPQEDIVF